MSIFGKRTEQEAFELFKRNNTRAMNGIDRNASFKNKYGDVSLEVGFIQYKREISEMLGLSKKVDEFESFLISQGIECVNSNISESRYYNYQGMKYRFSSHVYPTGSMTDDFCIDLCADPHLVNNITF